MMKVIAIDAVNANNDVDIEKYEAELNKWDGWMGICFLSILW